MKALVIDSFGGPEKLHWADVPTPVPTASQVQVEIAYTAVNPVDYKIREGHLTGVLPHHFPLILGWDASGKISAVGADVKDWKVGDDVFAYCRKPEVQWGTYAEYVTLEGKDVAARPKNVSAAQAAGIPLVALTAWQALFEGAELKAGEKVLVHAGSGGVGGYAVQFARNAGATVLSTAGPKNQGFLKELGAQHPIDYSKVSFAQVAKEVAPEGLDVVLDCVGGETLAQSFSVLKRGGRLISIVDTPDKDLSERLGIKSAWIFVRPDGKQLTEISQLIEAGKVQALPIAEMALAQAAEAHRESENRHIRGKIVLKVK